MRTTILGVKATHDGGFALLQGNRLALAVEWEKIGNNPRHSRPDSLEQIAEVMRQQGYDRAEVDLIAFDGWWPEDNDWLETPTPTTDEPAQAPYTETGDDLLTLPQYRGRIRFAGNDVPTTAIPHSVGHVYGSYCASPFAGGRALVLVWDGGMPATLYLVSPERAIRVGVVLPITGNLYPVFCSILEPYRDAWAAGPALSLQEPHVRFGDPRWSAYNLSVPGKAMAYAGLGRADREVIDIMDRHARAALTADARPTRIEHQRPVRALQDDVAWVTAVARDLRSGGWSDADLMASFQRWEYTMLERALQPHRCALPLVFTGGCALNIKWNSWLRSSGLFADVWVPPFPNDSGSALGAAAAAMVRNGADVALDWSVFCGPRLLRRRPPATWPSKRCTVADLAKLLALIEAAMVVVVVHGHAEIGPRALGARSILAPAIRADMQHRLNAAKGREHYRPVAPICLEEDAPRIFDPGTPDPYMLFDHVVRREWRDVIPAVVHADHTARLQTVNKRDNPVMHQLLTEYRAITGLPVLCNTSANYQGKGFFPDAASAMTWGMVGAVWSEDRVYSRG